MMLTTTVPKALKHAERCRTLAHNCHEKAGVALSRAKALIEAGKDTESEPWLFAANILIEMRDSYLNEARDTALLAGRALN